MLTLALGLLLFIAIHIVPMNRTLRSGLVERFGANAYKGAFSVISAIGLALIIYGYGKLQGAPGKNPELWSPPVFTRHIALALMLPAMVLLVAAYVPSNIRTAVGHPMLAALKIWAFSHLISNGDLGSVVLFGSLLAYAVLDRISVKRRLDSSGKGPLGAAKGSVSGDIIAIAGGLALYALLITGLHAHLVGVAPLPKWSIW